MKPSTRLRHFLCLASSALVAAPFAHALPGTWNADANGNWNDPANWASGTVAGGIGDLATLGDFISADRIINLNIAPIIGGITAADTTHNYTISGANTLTLDSTGSSAVSVATGRTLTIASVLAGNDGITKSGLGTLALSNANSISGTFALTAGALQLGNAASTGTSTLTMTSGTTLQLRNDVDTTFTSTNITTSAAGGIYNFNVNQATGAGTNKKLSLGNLTLANSASGTITSTLNVTGDNGYTLGLGTVNHQTGSLGHILEINASTAAATIARLDNGSFGTAVNFTGSNNVTLGIYQLNGNGVNTLTVNGANVTLGTTATASNRNGTGGGNPAQTYTLTSGTLNLTSTTSIANLKFSGTAARQPTFNINGGTLNNTSGSALVLGGLTSATQNNNAVISLGANFAFGTALSTAANDLNLGTGAVTLTANRIVTVNGATNLTLGGAISGNFTLTKAGSGTLTLGGTKAATAATTVTAGKLSISSLGNINATSGVTIGTASTAATSEFNYNSATALSKTVSFATGSTGGTLSGTGTITPATTISSGNTLAPGNSIGTLSFGTGLTLAGTYSVELGTVNANPASSLSDRAAVTGALVVGGNLTLVDNANANSQGSAAAGAYRIATYTTTRTGTFATITNPLSASLHEKVVYGPASGGGSVDLELYRLATGSTSDVNLGKARVGGSLAGNLTTTNSATVDGFSENLNASVGSNAGDVNASSGAITGLIAGASTSTISVGLSTTTSGAKAGTVLVSSVSDGIGTSGYGTTANGSQTVGVAGTVYDYASAAFGGGGLVNNGGGSWSLNFGTVNQNDATSTSFNLYNLFVSSFQDALGGSLGYTGSGVFTDLTTLSIAQIAASGSNLYNISFDTTNIGVFGGTLTFNGLSQQTGLSDASLSPLTLAISGTVVAIPEPRAALLGGLGMLALLRRRR